MIADTPINVDRLRYELRDHPDRHFVEYLCDGLTYGFDTLVPDIPLPSKVCKNLQSALKDSDTVTELIHKEVIKGFLQGPFHALPFSSYRVSPIGVAYGKYSGKPRLIVDLSSPHEDDDHPSVNNLIDKDSCSLSYVRIDDAIQLIQQLGKDTTMCKTDISDAFKLLPIHPSQWHLYGICWENQYYFYTRLAFGCRSSPKLFDNLSRAICWIAHNNYGVSHILHLLDDFITFEDPSKCGERNMQMLFQIFNSLNIPMALHKTCGPETVIEYLGIILDSHKMEARLPEDKLHRDISMLQSFQSRQSCTKRELLQLLGHLNFASKVIIPGRSFVSYIIKLSTTAKKLHHFVKISQECRSDIKMWISFLKHWNGATIFYDQHITKSEDIQLYTDASGSVGYGGYMQGQWFAEAWPDAIKEHICSGEEISIAFKELYPIVVAAMIWGHNWKGLRILFNCDNLATVAILQKGRSKAFVSFTDGEVPQVSSRGQQPAVCRTNSIRGFLGLTPIVDNLWETAIAPNTKQAYYTGFNNFIRFLLLAGILTDVKLSDLQVSEDMLIYFVAHCYNSDLAYSTIKLYVCGIKFMCLKHNIPFPGVDGLSRMHAILGGVKRSRRKISKPRYPVTFNILKDVIGYLRKTSHLFEDLMMRTACIVAFFGFLRCGEFTVGTSFDYTQHLCVSDLIVSDEYVMLHLKKSKTDPFREGVKIKLFKVGGIICPYAACCEYLSARMQFSPASHDPLFVVQNGQALTRSIFISKFKHTLQCIGINSELYNGHSFRIGAATSAAAAHVEDHLIKVLGRWSSDAYCRYIKTPQSCLRDAQIALTNSS
ncbi:uncharacterized protein [Argopecten irradians]|uniref:uncharacterized protein n=1 Tax=Argopecten irradians TaxID=31199 RepID=UPI00370F8FDE